ncbi:hypothetical protein MMC12_007905 [Toensbergia leucococca]|nr:hypothetical protein [Toensbergia leucococca]
MLFFAVLLSFFLLVAAPTLAFPTGRVSSFNATAQISNWFGIVNFPHVTYANISGRCYLSRSWCARFHHGSHGQNHANLTKIVVNITVSANGPIANSTVLPKILVPPRVPVTEDEASALLPRDPKNGGWIRPSAEWLAAHPGWVAPRPGSAFPPSGLVVPSETTGLAPRPIEVEDPPAEWLAAHPGWVARRPGSVFPPPGYVVPAEASTLAPRKVEMKDPHAICLLEWYLNHPGAKHSDVPEKACAGYRKQIDADKSERILGPGLEVDHPFLGFIAPPRPLV